ncbi:MAG: hypothetical protein ACXV8X_13950, partial [Candidatus Angelobacter sp.]
MASGLSQEATPSTTPSNPATPAAAAAQADVVTNQTVMDMVNAKLPADLIVTKIQTSKTSFDLSTDSLVKLNQNSVPSDV